MVISCPACSKKFQFNGEVKSRMRFKCSGCSTMFSVPEESCQARTVAKDRFRVLAATENALILDAVNSTLGDERLEVTVVPDGNKAMEAICADRPHLLILDAAIQGMFSFTICEKVKKDPALKEIKIILTSAAFNKSRYRRKPTELFGAEKYMEAHAIESELAQQAGELLGVVLKVAPISAGSSSAQAGEGAGDPKAQGEDAKARRLARVIAADILLYHRKKLSHKVAKQDALALFSPEIEEAVKYFTKRLPGADVSYIHAAIEECIESINTGGAQGSVCWN